MQPDEKNLSAVHLTMLALGTVIGGSFFLGSSVAIRAAGPAVIFAYLISLVLVYYILYALSEMTVANPHSGSFKTFATDAFGERTGFVVGWLYWTGLALGMSGEATATAILLRGWLPQAPTALLGAGIIVVVTLLNLLGSMHLSKLSSALSIVKILAVVSFIAIAVALITGLSGRPPVGLGVLSREPFAPGGAGGVVGSMLIVLFSFSGFEVIGLAASEVDRPQVTVPRAIRYTVAGLSCLYLLYIVVLLPLIPTAALDENTSAIVAALHRHGFGRVGAGIAAVVVSAIISSSLASIFALARMMRALAGEGHAPRWLREKSGVPFRCIAVSGAGVLAALGLGLLFPRVYIFLLSAGGFSILATYAVIMASHLRLRRRHGCPPEGKCQLHGFPYTSGFVLVALVAAIAGMPFIGGQSSGLVVGVGLIVFFQACYGCMRLYRRRVRWLPGSPGGKKPGFAAEFSQELSDTDKDGPV